jgi:hypothetical protein
MAFELATQAGSAQWAALGKYRSNAQIAIVYLKPARRGFVAFPRRMVQSEADWAPLVPRVTPTLRRNTARRKKAGTLT